MESSQAAMQDQERYEDSHLGGYLSTLGLTQRKYTPSSNTVAPSSRKLLASKAREGCARQQLEEISLQQEQHKNPGTKKQRENKDQNQGESAAEKSRFRAGTRGLVTSLIYRNRNREKELFSLHMTLNRN
ncbi:hypothetical protein STEG23_001462 [Scotinomys teguina]